MGWNSPSQATAKQQSLLIDLSPEQEEIIDILKNKGNTSVDHLCGVLGKSQSKIASTLLDLELEGIVKSQPGKIYELY